MDTEHKKVFISYSWDSEAHRNWILQLANKLIENGVNVILDQYESTAGKNLTHSMEKNIKESDKVLLILTPNYKIKAEGRLGGVGFEYSLINEELYRNQIENRKFIPILREGDPENSIPGFLKSFIWLNMNDVKRFEADFEILLREIYDEPIITKPPLGKRPSFATSILNTKKANNLASIEDFAWWEKSPKFIETFDFENTIPKLFETYSEDIWLGKTENGVFKLINNYNKTAVKFHHLNYNKNDMANFATTVEVQIMNDNSPDASCGLQFCYDIHSRNYYSFVINNNQQYKLWLKTEAGYKVILSQRTNFIVPNVFNKLVP